MVEINEIKENKVNRPTHHTILISVDTLKTETKENQKEYLDSVLEEFDVVFIQKRRSEEEPVYYDLLPQIVVKENGEYTEVSKGLDDYSKNDLLELIEKIKKEL